MVICQVYTILKFIKKKIEKKQLSQLEKLSIEKTLKMKLDNETQSFKVWPKPFKKLFTLSGSSLQIN